MSYNIKRFDGQPLEELKFVVNANLQSGMTYESVDQGKSGAVKGGLFQDGKLERWVFKLKTKEMADEMSKYLEQNKKN